jgi:hypothetical protein
VQEAYNDLQQLAVQYQAVSGSVNTSTTPSVQYNYNLMACGENNSNLTSMVYPNGHIVDYDYSAGQLPVTGISVSGTTATVTTAVADGLSTGATVVIQGSAQAALNGTFTITVTSSTTFTYTFTGSASSDSSADITETPFSLDTAISRPDGLQDQAGSAAGTVLQGYTHLAGLAHSTPDCECWGARSSEHLDTQSDRPRKSGRPGSGIWIEFNPNAVCSYKWYQWVTVQMYDLGADDSFHAENGVLIDGFGAGELKYSMDVDPDAVVRKVSVPAPGRSRALPRPRRRLFSDGSSARDSASSG